MAGLHFDITGDNSNFLRKLEESRNGVRNTSKQIEESGMSIEQMFGRITASAAAFGAGFTAKELISSITRVRGEFQQLEVAFNTMLGSKEQADTLMSQLVRTAAITPFDLQGVANGAKQLLAYGTSAEDVNGTLVRLGDIAAGLSIPLNDLVYLYGTTMTQGQLFTNDFRQFQGRGIPLADELAKQFGVTKDKVGELVTAGRVGFPEVQKAIESMTNEGSKFGGLMEAQSKTITGQISNIEDAFDMMYNNLGKQSEGAINTALSGVSFLVENYESVGREILALAATYGTYKAVLISVAAYQGAVTGIAYSSEITELQKLIPLKEKSINEDVLAAVSSGKLTQSKAEQVIALRAEITAKLSSLQATKAQADAELASVTANYKAALQRNIVARQNMALAQSQMQIAIQSGSAEEIALAKKNAQSAALEVNSAAIAKNNAHKSLSIAATNSKSASEAVNTLQTSANTVSQNANTVSTNILTVAKNRLAAASKALGLSMLANPYVLTAAAIAGLGYGIYKLITYQTDAEKAQLKLNDAIKEADKSSISEQRELAKLKGELSALTKGTDEYNAVKDKIIKGFEKYYTGLDAEIEKVGLTEAAYNKLTVAINKSFGARQYEKFVSDQQYELSNTMSENLEKIQNRLLSTLGNEYGSKIYTKIRNSIMQESLSLGKEGLEIKGLDRETKTALDKASGNGFIRNRIVEGSIKNIILANKLTNDLDKKAKIRFGVEDSKTGKNENKSQNKDIPDIENKTLKQLIIDIDTANTKLKSLQKQANNGLISSDKVKEQSDLLSNLKSDYKLRTGKEYGSSNKESAAEKLRKEQESIRSQSENVSEIERKQAIDRQRLQEDLAYQVAQSEIDALEDGFEKKQRQRKLDNQKEIQALERQKEDYIRAVIQAEKDKFDAQEELKSKQTKGYVKKTFDSSSVSVDTSAFDYIIGNTSKKQSNGKIREQEDAWNEYLIKFGNYQQKRKAIIEKYDKEIAEATIAGDAATLEKNKQNALDELDNSIKNSATLMGQLFTDASQKSAGEIQKIIEKAELLMQYLEAVKDEQGNAQIGGKTVSKKDILGLGISDNTLKNLELSTEQVESLRNAIDRMKGDLASKSPFKLFETQIETATNKIIKGGKKNIAQGISEIGEAVTSFSPAVSQFGKDLGNIFGSDDLGNKIAGISDSIGGLGKTASGVGQIISGDIVGGAMSAVSGISSVVSALDGMFGADYSEFQAMKDEYESLLSIWDSLIDKKKEYISESYGSEIYEIGKEALDLIKKKADYAKRVAEAAAGAGSSVGSHSIAARQNEDLSWAKDQLYNQIGLDYSKDGYNNLTSALYSASAEQLQKVKETMPEFWNSLDDDFRKALQDVIDYQDEYNEMIDDMKERFTGISFDSFLDGFLDKLSDMDYASKDFAEDFEKNLEKSIINSIIGSKYKDDIKKLYEEWSKIGEDGQFSDKEIERLRELQKKTTDQMIADRDKLAESLGFDMSSSSSQDSTKRGFETMTQDQAGELNGRFAALNVSNEDIRNSMLSMLVFMNAISVSVSDNSITLIEIKNLMVSSNGYLEDIAKYTKELIGFKQIIQNIESSSKSIAGK